MLRDIEGQPDAPAASRVDVVADSAPARQRRRASMTLAGSAEGWSQLPGLMSAACAAMLDSPRPWGPLPVGSPSDVLRAAMDQLGPPELPTQGIGADAALRWVARVYGEHGINLSHPRAAAHLQPPPLAVAVAADALASASNASLDTYDSGPSAIAMERWLVAALADMAGFGARADGVLTPGGSLSNLLALLLARDAAALRRGVDARHDGVRSLRGALVICSELAHFSTHRACAALGLGEAAVRAVPVDSARRMLPDCVRELLRNLNADETPVAIVATAGTTDFGSIDPLPELADIAAEYGVWLHVDAAYGFGALFSERLSYRLRGVERANSITVDLHKLGWQPASASAVLLADAASFGALNREVAYLNPRDDADAGLDGLLGRSLQTTRRPDAVKVVATLLAHGRRGLGDMVDICHELARHAEWRIRHEPSLELVSPAQLTTVVFRHLTSADAGAAYLDDHNAALRRRLIEAGGALIGRTAVRLPGDDTPRVCLKLTLLNPTATSEDIDELIEAVLRAGRELEREAAELSA